MLESPYASQHEECLAVLWSLWLPVMAEIMCTHKWRQVACQSVKPNYIVVRGHPHSKPSPFTLAPSTSALTPVASTIDKGADS
jgi:hypothetical protein